MEWNSDYLSTCKEDLVNTTLQQRCQTSTARSTACLIRANCDKLGALDSCARHRWPM
jgi:hypothetical protein